MHEFYYHNYILTLIKYTADMIRCVWGIVEINIRLQSKHSSGNCYG